MPNAYSLALDTCLSELGQLVRERAALAKKIDDKDEAIRSRLDTAMSLSKQIPEDDSRHQKLLALAGEVPAIELQLTEAVLDALYRSENALTPKEVKKALETARFDFSGFTNPLASIHSTLRRLSNRPEVNVHTGLNGKAAYRWVGTRYGARRSLANMLATNTKRPGGLSPYGKSSSEDTDKRNVAIRRRRLHKSRI
jgi:hypothetical protein